MVDISQFFLNDHGVILYVLIYVDDFVINGSSPSKVHDLIASLSQWFSLKDLGDLSDFLGMEVLRTPQGPHLFQCKYIGYLLHRFEMNDSKPRPMPMCAFTSLTLRDGVPLEDGSDYRTLVGSLQYMLLTRPDIAFVVRKLSQFMHKPTTTHQLAAKRVLRYLKGTYTSGIFLARSNQHTLYAYSDTDWGENKEDYTSIGSHVVFLG